MWFAKDGSWLNDGNPELGLNPSPVELDDRFDLIYPVVGFLGCTEEIEIHVNFGPPFAHAAPAGFVPFKSDECSCTAAFVHCMTSLGCDDKTNLQQLSQHCVEKGCTPESCGLQADMRTPWLCDSVVPVGEFRVRIHGRELRPLSCGAAGMVVDFLHLLLLLAADDAPCKISHMTTSIVRYLSDYFFLFVCILIAGRVQPRVPRMRGGR